MWNKKIIEPRYAFVLLVVMVGFSGIGLSKEGKNQPVSVVQCSNQTTSLEERWQWALEQMARQPVTKHIWIGFSIERLMSEHSLIGRWPVDPDYPTLSELIYDVRVELPERSYSRYRAFHKVIKEVAHLFEVNRAPKSIGQIQTSNISLTVYMNQGVLFWLGKVGHAQAFSLLRKLYDDTNDDYLKKRLMGRITDLDHPQVVSFLDDVLQNEKSERVRKEAVEELDHYQSQESLDILLRTVRNDPSAAVKKEAIDSLSHIESSAAEDALIEIAKTGSPPIVRREAIDKLRDIASDKVINCMVSIINQDAIVEIQREALESLARMENEKAMDRLIQIVQAHSNPWIRYEAIDELKRYASPKIIDCLEGVINKQDEVYKIQQEALESLTRIENDKALDTLMRIAQTHGNPRIREDAIEKLDDMDELKLHSSSRIIQCLENIINNQNEFEKIQLTALDLLAEYETNKALDALIRICQTHNHPRIRREGINELRDIDELRLSAFPKAVDCLAFVVNKKNELQENQLEALDALADIENNKATDVLIQVAGHHTNPRIREEAIDHLSDMDELRLSNSVNAIKCFESIIDNQKELEKIQRRALDALKDIEHQDVRTYITKIARSHPKQKIRREAQEIVAEWIRDS
jgi:HEAT repeat protein